MNMLSRIIVWGIFCCAAVIAGRIIAHTVAPTGAPAYGYISSPSSSYTDITSVQTSSTDETRIASTPVVLSPRPTRILALPTVSPISTATSTGTSARLRATARTRSPTPVLTKTSISSPTTHPVITKATPGGAYFTYTVKKGDTLLEIAKSFNIAVKDILAINDISDPASLQVGDVIHIPAHQ